MNILSCDDLKNKVCRLFTYLLTFNCIISELFEYPEVLIICTSRLLQDVRTNTANSKPLLQGSLLLGDEDCDSEAVCFSDTQHAFFLMKKVKGDTLTPAFEKSIIKYPNGRCLIPAWCWCIHNNGKF